MRRQFGLAELAEEAATPARTVRFYIARGLLPGPEARGRSAFYTEEHLARLRQIQKLRAEGLMLSEIALALGGGRTQAPQPAATWSYEVAPDVTVYVRAGAAPWRLKQIQAVVAGMYRQLADQPLTGGEAPAVEAINSRRSRRATKGLRVSGKKEDTK